MSKRNSPTIESMDELAQRINALADESRAILLTLGKPASMTPEEWAEIVGGSSAKS